MHPLLQGLVAFLVLVVTAGLVGALIFTGVWGVLQTFHARVRNLELEFETVRKLTGRWNGTEGARRKAEAKSAQESTVDELRRLAEQNLARTPLRKRRVEDGLVEMTPDEVKAARDAADKLGKA